MQGDVEPFIVDLTRAKNSPPDTPLISSKHHQNVGGLHGGGNQTNVEGLGFPGITFWKQQPDRGGGKEAHLLMRTWSGRSPSRSKQTPHFLKQNEGSYAQQLLYYNRSGTGLSGQLWHHWKHQHPKSNIDTNMVHSSEMNVTQEVNTRDERRSVSLKDPMAPSLYRKASAEEVAEDDEPDQGEIRYKFKEDDNELRIVAASLRIVYHDRWRRTSERIDIDDDILHKAPSEETNIEEEKVCLTMVDGYEGIKIQPEAKLKFLHLAPLIQSSLKCAGTIVPHRIPRHLLLQGSRGYDQDFKEARDMASLLASSAVGFFLLIMTTFYVIYFL